jgi:hypothetical protein
VNTLAGESNGSARNMIRPIQIGLKSLAQTLPMSTDISRGSAKIGINGDVRSDSSFSAGNSDLNLNNYNIT